MNSKNTITKMGRPLIFKSANEMQKVIDEYFDWCDNRAVKIWDEKNQKEIMVSSPAPYTMSGLARRLGIDRKTLVNYSNKDKFILTIARARERVHEDVETRLMGTKNERGAMFSLKNNFGWKEDTSTVNISGEKILVIPSELIGKYEISSNTEPSGPRQEPVSGS